ncbi:TPA: DUF4760 domain-containing protein [Klebsiella pneumoniae]|uniref:DUF4760 domain-containing protein n=1 Tax=Klebsiella pneumoniae TaxID=573 RepID=UPI000CD20045|nr:DUF4760 domain-containing protein [Klebsiella pneumoniae]HDS9502979.1 DUF4760 domain-containing protein [Klebsiella variicola]AUU95302.1 DUF4760 domain-containing protein [Klebsiella pneumoniae]EJQ7903894.1 DUF4760 domain-containing protein [Klebsiella pneumoniae]EKZ6214791.1 DUF4760 domain-containing protein [Klebsiella pneumoniae]MCE0210823.1 DUF4760 domain-containing protein [Klebsiella pneumoniae]
MNEYIFELLGHIWTFLVDLWDKNPTFYPGMIGAYIAVTSIRTQRRTSREKNSLDFEAAYKRNKEVVDAWAEVMRIYKDRGTVPVEEWGRSENSQTEGAKALKTIFNEWERCANAVNNGLYDDKYLYKVYGSTLIFLDVHFEPYMAECRKTNPRFYRNMKCLALKWRVRRAYEDADKETKEYQELLKQSQKLVDKLHIRF